MILTCLAYADFPDLTHLKSLLLPSVVSTMDASMEDSDVSAFPSGDQQSRFKTRTLILL